MNLLTENDIKIIVYELTQRVDHYESKRPFGQYIYEQKIKRLQSIIDKLHGAKSIKIYHPEPESIESINPIELTNFLKIENEKESEASTGNGIHEK